MPQYIMKNHQYSILGAFGLGLIAGGLSVHTFSRHDANPLFQATRSDAGSITAYNQPNRLSERPRKKSIAQNHRTISDSIASLSKAQMKLEDAQIVGNYADADPKTTLEWFVEKGINEMAPYNLSTLARIELFQIAMKKLVGTDREFALAMIQKMPAEGADRDLAIEALSRAAVGDNLSSALLADSVKLLSGDVQSRAIASILGEWAAFDADAALAAMDKLPSNLKAEFDFAEIHAVADGVFLSKNSIEAAEFLYEYSSDKISASADGVGYFDGDADGAIKWLGQLNNKKAKSEGLALLAAHLASDNPQRALEIATTIPEEDIAKRTWQNILNGVSESVATNALKNTSIPEDWKKVFIPDATIYR